MDNEFSSKNISVGRIAMTPSPPIWIENELCKFLDLTVRKKSDLSETTKFKG